MLAFVLALVAGAAQALGLGQIQVKSQPGQPLLAEIPIISGDPSELEHLHARLASPETFRRVGLQPPDVAATGLKFAVAVDGRGWPVIRVTSTAPIQQPLLTFLLEVDWGEGRLVREYTALLEAPTTVAAAPAQPMQAPVVAPANTIERGTAPAAPVAAPPAPEAAPLPANPDVVAEPLPEPTPIATIPEVVPEPVPAPTTVSPVPAATPVASPPSAYTVAGGDTLSEIASGLDRHGHSLDQTMLALLRTNPEAFIGGNINLLREGAVLRMPEDGELSRYSAGDAAARVRSQVTQWRESMATRQPQADASDALVANQPGQAVAEADTAEAAPAEARLQIVPPASTSGKAGTQTGIQAGGEGQMLQQQIQETQETLVARDAEVGELRARVAELEKLQQQQQQLIAMKDSALAAAQQRLAETGTASPAAAGAEPESGPVWPWIVVPLLVLLAAAAWWWLRGPREKARPRIFEPAARTAGGGKPTPKAPVRVEPAVAPAAPPSFVATPVPEPEPEPAPDPEPAPLAAGPAPVSAPEPVLELEPAPTPVPTPAMMPGTTPAEAPHWTAAPALVGTPPSTTAAAAAAALAAGREQATTPARQVELARAYLDLGDEGAAREVLREVLDGRDPVARDIASRMLREL